MTESNIKIFWKTEKRKISDLTETQNNPRILTKTQKSDLEKSLKKFNLAEIPVINKDNTILAGHQRLKVLAEIKGSDYEIDIRLPNRQLNDKEAEEYLIRSNKNSGEWNFDILANEFEKEELIEWGFQDLELGFVEEEQETEKDISDKLNERFVIEIECENEEEQELIFSELKQKGYKCKNLTL